MQVGVCIGLDRAVFPAYSGDLTFTTRRPGGGAEGSRPIRRSGPTPISGRANARAMAESWSCGLRRRCRAAPTITSSHRPDQQTCPERSPPRRWTGPGSSSTTTRFRSIPASHSIPRLRLGSPAITSRGLKEPEARQVAAWIDRVISQPTDEVAERVLAEVRDLTKKFPAPGIG